MLSKVFLDRPVFAWVIAIFIMLLGGLSIYNLPISQYPPIAPPAIAITAYYPGASAQTVENSVTQIIEQKMTGLDNDWAVRAIKAGGNYGEIFAANIGEQTPIKLARGLNAQWTQGGLMYAPPFR